MSPSRRATLYSCIGRAPSPCHHMTPASQNWKRVEFSRKRETEGDPTLDCHPATYKGTQEEHRGDQGQAGDHHQAPQQGQEGPQAQAQGGGSRERWSFSPPTTWTERPRRPLTRSVTTRRQETRERVQHRAEDRDRQTERGRRK